MPAARWLSATLRPDAARVIPPLGALMETLWAYPWFVWAGDWDFVDWQEPPLTLGSAILLTFAAMLMARGAQARGWSAMRTLLVALPALLLLAALAARLDLGGGHALRDTGWWAEYAVERQAAVFGALAFGAYLLWRGIIIGMESPSFEVIYRRFLFGLLALVSLLALRGLIPGADEGQNALESTGFYVVGFLCIGLLSMGLVNLRAVWEEMRRRDEASGAASRRWFSMLTGVVFAIIAVSLVAASVFSFNLAVALLQPLRTLADLLLTLFIYVVALPLAIAATLLVYVFRFLASLIPQVEPPTPPAVPGPEGVRRIVEGEATSGLSIEAAMILKWGLVALVAIVVIFILARALFRYARDRRREEDVDEVSESLWTWDGFKADMRSFLSRLFGRFRHARRPAPPAASPPPSTAREADTSVVFSVRDIYRGLLWETRRAGVPRRLPETPGEYRDRLEANLPPGDDALRAITQAYIEERYGQMNATGERLNALNRSWRALRAALRGRER